MGPLTYVVYLVVRGASKIRKIFYDFTDDPMKPAPRIPRLVLGFDSVANMMPGQTSDICSRPLADFYCERLVIPFDIVRYFQVDCVQIGTRNQFINSYSLPAALFSSEAADPNLVMDMARTGQTIKIRVTNIGEFSYRFRAAMVGTAKED